MKRFSIIATAALFLAVALWYGRPVDGVWNSPDETANAFWAARVAAGEPLRLVDSLVGQGNGAIHPRSMGVAGDALVPGSFPGLILIYGALKIIFKLPFYLYTPILTVLAGICLGALASKLFDRRVGVWTTLLFLIHPAVLYYGSRGLFHNVLFVDLLVLAAAFFVLRPLRSYLGARETADDALGGFIFAWALVVRTSEAVWVIPAFLAFLPFVGKERWRRLAFAVIGGLIPLFVLLRINTTIYGSPFQTAYAPPAVVTESQLTSPSPVTSFEAVPKEILPFGIHPRLIVRNVWNYGFKLFWWQSILVVVGFAWWLVGYRKASGPQKTYVLMTFLSALWLAVLYGSWFIRDRFDANSVTIGTSYVRYFLPAYVAATPLAALALVRFCGLSSSTRLTRALLILCVMFGLRSAVWAGDESLSAVRSTLEGNAVKKSKLLRLIEPEAVIMTERFDKMLVPERLRIIPAIDSGSFGAAANALESFPVYWYGLNPGEAEARKLAGLALAHDMSWSLVANPVPGETLLKLVWRQDEWQDTLE